MELALPQRQRPPIEFGFVEPEPGALRIGDGQALEAQPRGPGAADIADLDLRLARIHGVERKLKKRMPDRCDVEKPGAERDEPERKPGKREDECHCAPGDPSRAPVRICLHLRHQKACPSET